MNERLHALIYTTEQDNYFNRLDAVKAEHVKELNNALVSFEEKNGSGTIFLAARKRPHPQIYPFIIAAHGSKAVKRLYEHIEKHLEGNFHDYFKRPDHFMARMGEGTFFRIHILRDNLLGATEKNYIELFGPEETYVVRKEVKIAAAGTGVALIAGALLALNQLFHPFSGTPTPSYTPRPSETPTAQVAASHEESEEIPTGTPTVTATLVPTLTPTVFVTRTPTPTRAVGPSRTGVIESTPRSADPKKTMVQNG